MFRMLIDTSVWLDLAKDQKQVPVLGLVEEMIKRGLLSLIVPRVVIDEFQKNRERVAKESAKSLSAHFRLVKEAIGKVSGDKKKTRVILSHLDDVDHKIPIMGGAAVGTLDRIERMLTAASIIETSRGSEALRSSTGDRSEGSVPSREERDGRRDSHRDIRRMRTQQASVGRSVRVCHAQQE